MSSPSFHKNLLWQIEAWVYKAISNILKPLPAKSLFRIGEITGYVLWPFMKKRRAFIFRNVRIAGDLSNIESQRFARKSFVRTIANLFCSSLCSIKEPISLSKLLTIDNPELLHEASAKGKGVILLLAHMGNWELLTQICNTCAKGKMTGAFYRPLNNPILDNHILKLRESSGIRMFSKRDGFHLVNHFLKENGILGILVDQRAGWQGRIMPFFGRLTRVSPIPNLLARRSKCEMLALSFRTISPGAWRAQFHKVTEPYSLANCYEALEEAMKVSLIDVFWLQERWKVYFDKTRKPADWLERTERNGTKKHRVIVWKTSSDIHQCIPSDYLHDDIEHEIIIDEDSKNLKKIDLRKKLPIDYILVFKPDLKLEKFAAKLGIKIYNLAE